MNYNVAAYSIYFAIMAFVILRVGALFHRSGGVYVECLFPDEVAYGHWLNDLLLRAYYLLTCGYVAVGIVNWPTIHDMTDMCGFLTYAIGFLLTLLGILHYLNMIGLLVWAELHKKKNKFNPNPRNNE